MALTDTLSSSAHAITDFGLVAMKGGYHEDTLSDDATLDQTFPTWVGFDPGGSGRTITLDGTVSAAGEAAFHGLWRVLTNRADGAEDLTVEDFGTNSIGTISQNETGVFYQDEDSGWTLVFIITGALS